MTDKEIIQEFEEHIERTINLKYGARKMVLVDVELLKNTLNLINRQQAEIERLQEQDEIAEKIIREQADRIFNLQSENGRLTDRNFELSEKGEKAVIAYIAAKNEAVKEFAEKLCEGRVSNDPVVIAVNVELKMIGGEEK